LPGENETSIQVDWQHAVLLVIAMPPACLQAHSMISCIPGSFLIDPFPSLVGLLFPSERILHLCLFMVHTFVGCVLCAMLAVVR
jgi:hypothetical protein